jgi:hypothetical protein
LTARQLAVRGALGGLATAGATALLLATVSAAKTLREAGGSFDPGAALAALVRPQTAGDWMELAGVALVAAIAGLFTAAVAAARHGAAAELADTPVDAR